MRSTWSRGEGSYSAAKQADSQEFAVAWPSGPHLNQMNDWRSSDASDYVTYSNLSCSSPLGEQAVQDQQRR